jgi:NADH dehydrogenase FAD-containing subunit
MKRVVIVGGGVGGTLVANLVSRKLAHQIDAGTASVTVIAGEHVY